MAFAVRTHTQMSDKPFPPMAFVYQIGDDEIYIIAVMHLNREPAYWQHREV